MHRKIEFYDEIQSEIPIKWLKEANGDPCSLNFRRAIDQKQLQHFTVQKWVRFMCIFQLALPQIRIDWLTNETKNFQKTPHLLNF